MKKEEKCFLILKCLLGLLRNLEPQERLWILDNQLPQYICSVCGDDFTDCQHDEEFQDE